MNRILKFLSFVLPFAPAIALAQVNTYQPGFIPGGQDALGVLGVISNIFGVVIPILITLAVIWVIVGIIGYVTAKDDEKKKEARKTILHAIISLFVIVSIWGLVALLNNTFGISQGGANVGNCQPVYDPDQNIFVLPPGCV